MIYPFNAMPGNDLHLMLGCMIDCCRATTNREGAESGCRHAQHGRQARARRMQMARGHVYAHGILALLASLSSE